MRSVLLGALGLGLGLATAAWAPGGSASDDDLARRLDATCRRLAVLEATLGVHPAGDACGPAGTVRVPPLPPVALGSRGWLEALIPATEAAAADTLVSLSTSGNSAGVFGTRSSAGAGSPSMSGFAIGTFAVNDNTAYARTTYTAYMEARRAPGVSGVTQGIEVGITNGGDLVPTTPYSANPAGATLAFRTSAGRFDVPGEHDISNAFSLVAGPVRFDKGFVIDADSVAQGPVGAEVFALGRGHAAVWYAPDGPTAVIRSDAGTRGRAPVALVFTDYGLDLTTRDGVHSLVVADSRVVTANLTVALGQVLGSCPPRPDGLPRGSLWCSGTAVHRVP